MFKNVLIETGREEVTPNNIVTKTKLVSMYIENGLIKQITDTVPSDADGVVDAKGVVNRLYFVSLVPLLWGILF